MVTVGVPVDEEALLRAAAQGTSPATAAERLFTFGFIGSANAVNRQAMNGLIELISDQIAAWQGRAQLLIVGRVLDDIDLPSHLAGVVEGVRFVPELSDFYDQCNVVLVPTIVSTGLKIKSIEALSYGKPVVATADGFDGVNSPFAVHNCASQKDLVEVCRRIITGEMPLAEVAAMTDKLVRLYRREYERNAGALIGALERYRVAVMLPPDGNSDLLHAYLFSLLRFLSRRCRVDLHCAGPHSASRSFVALLRQLGGSVRLVMDPTDAAFPTYELVIRGLGQAVPAEPPARLTLTCSQRELQLSGPALDRATAFAGGEPICHVFPAVRPVDLMDEPYWAARRRLVVYICRQAIPGAVDWLAELGATRAFAFIRGDYDERRIVTAGDPDPLASCARAHGFAFARLREHLFDAPWNARKDLVILGEVAPDEMPICAALMSVSATRVFVHNETLLTLAKVVCGADIAVRRFASPEHLCLLLGRALHRTNTAEGALMRYLPNRGSITRVTETLKHVLIEDTLDLARNAR